MSGRFIVGDVLEQLRKLPDESVNCVVTSPPYWGLRDYGTGTWNGGRKSCAHTRLNPRADHSRGKYLGTRGKQSSTNAASTPMRSKCSRCGAVRVDKQIGLERSLDRYLQKIVTVFREVRRVLRKDGTLWLNLGDSHCGGKRGGIGEASTLKGSTYGQNESRKAQSARASFRRDRAELSTERHRSVAGLKPKDLIGIPWRVAFALQADGWYLRMDNIWHKPQPMPESVRDRTTRAHEYVFLLSKSARYHYDADAIKEVASEQTHSRVAVLGAGKNERSGNRLHDGLNQRWRVKQNESFEASLGSGQVTHRNKRSVWTIPTQPSNDDHFASFPEDLVVPCILAGCPGGGARA